MEIELENFKFVMFKDQMVLHNFQLIEQSVKAGGINPGQMREFIKFSIAKNTGEMSAVTLGRILEKGGNRLNFSLRLENKSWMRRQLLNLKPSLISESDWQNFFAKNTEQASLHDFQISQKFSCVLRLDANYPFTLEVGANLIQEGWSLFVLTHPLLDKFRLARKIFTDRKTNCPNQESWPQIEEIEEYEDIPLDPTQAATIITEAASIFKKRMRAR